MVRGTLLEKRGVAAFPATSPRRAVASVPLAVRIADLERELDALRREQRDRVVAAIVAVIGPGVAFSAADVFAHRAVSPPLASALQDAGIVNRKQLGRLFRRCGLVERVTRDRRGCIWILSTP